MKPEGAIPRKRDPKDEYDAALAYYQRTVWEFVKDAYLGGNEYTMAVLTFNRLEVAQRKWLDSLSPKARVNAEKSEPNLTAKYRPRGLKKSETVTPLSLATIAAIRYEKSKPTSPPLAIAEAHSMLACAHDYLENFREPESDADVRIDATYARVTFAEISRNTHCSERLHLLPTEQKKRHDRRLTLRAVEMAVERFGEKVGEDLENESKTVPSAPGKPDPDPDKQRIEQERLQRVRLLTAWKAELAESMKSKMISLSLLEEIRWDRFQGRLKNT